MIAFGIPHGGEWLIILAVVLLLFGHRLPSMARNLGSGISQFKRGLKEDSDSQSSGDQASSADGETDSSNDGKLR